MFLNSLQGVLLEHADLLPALHQRLQALYLIHDVFKGEQIQTNPFAPLFGAIFQVLNFARRDSHMLHRYRQQIHML